MNGQMLSVMGLLIVISTIGICFICKYLWDTLPDTKKVWAMVLFVMYIGLLNIIGMVFFPYFMLS